MLYIGRRDIESKAIPLDGCWSKETGLYHSRRPLADSGVVAREVEELLLATRL